MDVQGTARPSATATAVRRAANGGPRRGIRAVAALGAAGALVLSGTACGGSDGAAEDGTVTITVNGQPPKAQKVERKIFDQDIQAFEKANPKIKIDAKEGFMEPAAFQSKLAGGQLEDVYYVYFTDPAGLIKRGQAADITEAAADSKVLKSVQPELLDVFSDDEDKLFGLPTANYSMGLVYNRAVFEKAGLDPDKPPATWDEVRKAAKKISDLGDGHVGFGELSTNNQGGWHFNAWMNSLGADTVDRGSGKATFDDANGRKILTTLHDMRWKDDSMGEKQLLEFEDLQRMMGGGKLGMYLGAPDNLKPIVDNFEGDFKDYGLAPMPEAKGTLIGGEGYMFNPKADPATIKAGLTYLEWRFLNPERFQARIDDALTLDSPVGLPMTPTPDIWTGEIRDEQLALKEKNANVPIANYQSFVDAQPTIPGHIEPPEAQQVYAALDVPVQAVLTKEGADIDKLLKDTAAKVDDIIAKAAK